jgi:hypothetical protein
MQRLSLIVRSLWAACLLIGALNHARILLQHGLSWDYGGVGWASAAYWSSLTILDPLAAALLFARPKPGIVTAAMLIVTNVIHNLAVTAQHAPEGEFLARAANPFVISQLGFMLFVAATARIAWNGIESRRRSINPSSKGVLRGDDLPLAVTPLQHMLEAGSDHIIQQRSVWKLAACPGLVTQSWLPVKTVRQGCCRHSIRSSWSPHR